MQVNAVQIVGQSCGVCGRRIVSVVSAVSCAPCGVAFDQACLGEAQACPRCGVRFAVSQEEARGEEENKIRKDLSVGRRLLLLCLALLLVPNLIYLTAVLVSEWPPGFEAGRAILNTGFTCLMYSLIYFGIPWARMLLMASLFLSVIVLTAALISSIATDPPAITGTLSFLTVMELFVLLILVFSRRVRWFLEAQQTPVG